MLYLQSNHSSITLKSMTSSLNKVTYINKENSKETTYEVLKTVDSTNSVTFKVLRNGTVSDTLMVDNDGGYIVTYGDGLGKRLENDFFDLMGDQEITQAEYDKRVNKWQKVYTKYINTALSPKKFTKK